MPKQNQFLEKRKTGLRLQKSLAYEVLLEDTKKIMPEIALERSLTVFQDARIAFDDALSTYWKTVRDTPLLTAFLDWMKEHRSNDLTLEYAKIIVENGLIQFLDVKKQPVKLCDLTQANLKIQIDEIRCREKYSIMVREKLVGVFLVFFSWLSTHTLQYVPELEDPDKQRTGARLMDHETFISLVELLDERCRMIAKLLYFGGDRTLDEVVKLQIEDVDFKNQRINLQGVLVNYPRHVFEDIKLLIGNRSSGAVFLGRNSSSINPSTMFRKFKETGHILGIHELSPKALTAQKS